MLKCFDQPQIRLSKRAQREEEKATKLISLI